MFGPLSLSEQPVLGRPQLRPLPPGSLFGPLSLSEQPLWPAAARPLPPGSPFGPLSESEQPLCSGAGLVADQDERAAGGDAARHARHE